MERGRHYLEEIQLKIIFRKVTTTDKIKDLCVLILPIIILMDKEKTSILIYSLLPHQPEGPQ